MKEINKQAPTKKNVITMLKKFGIDSTLLYALLYSVCVGFIIATVVCCGVFEGGRKKYDKQESSQPTIMELRKM